MDALRSLLLLDQRGKLTSDAPKEFVPGHFESKRAENVNVTTCHVAKKLTMLLLRSS